MIFSHALIFSCIFNCAVYNNVIIRMLHSNTFLCLYIHYKNV